MTSATGRSRGRVFTTKEKIHLGILHAKDPSMRTAHLILEGVGPLDTLIASQAIGRKLILVSKNKREFRSGSWPPDRELGAVGGSTLSASEHGGSILRQYSQPHFSVLKNLRVTPRRLAGTRTHPQRRRASASRFSVSASLHVERFRQSTACSIAARSSKLPSDDVAARSHSDALRHCACSWMPMRRALSLIASTNHRVLRTRRITRARPS
jgi:hypothetical protein